MVKENIQRNSAKQGGKSAELALSSCECRNRLKAFTFTPFLGDFNALAETQASFD